ncbi:SMI1/KNR4 family protein [Gelidibacter salicanalis]|uniref:SMI1/KNR4 family protein n=1 Tax=Gelidibacter salicanalis TaxID=291193 RepID=A0A934KJ35_9FLAO|nr:SMI1/KNR4 family protein [Gelidibacter salicanalis]MBJ7880431.1 SMI1/KNR4 family protein [Gelidibacter salicanalis]
MNKQEILNKFNFKLPKGFVDFYINSNNLEIQKDEGYIILWSLEKMEELNHAYQVDVYAPEFFIFGSDGADTAFAIERKTGLIYEMPFIGMGKDDATLIGDSIALVVE